MCIGNLISLSSWTERGDSGILSWAGHGEGCKYHGLCYLSSSISAASKTLQLSSWACCVWSAGKMFWPAMNEKDVLKPVVSEERSVCVCVKEGSQVQKSLLSSVQAGQGHGEMFWCIITAHSQWVDMECAFLHCTYHKIPGVYGPSLYWEMPHRPVLP